MDKQTSTPRLPETESTDSPEQLGPVDTSVSQAGTDETAETTQTVETTGSVDDVAAEDLETDHAETDQAETDHVEHVEADGPEEKPERPRVTTVMRFIVAPILIALAVLCGIFATLMATIWKPDPTATAQASTQTRYVVTDPGVLPLGNEQVTITVKADDAKDEICLAVGTATDVSGWVASHGYTRVEGLETWSQLKTSTQSAAKDSDAKEESSLLLKDSDMWLGTKCGTGSARLEWKATDANQALIVDTNPSAEATDTKGAKAAVSLTWVRTEVLNLTTPLIFLAGLLVVAAVLCATVFALIPQKRRKKQLEHAKTHNDIEDGAERGLDSPRWVNDHIASHQRAQRTSHRRSAEKKPLFSRFIAKKATEEPDESDAAPTIVDVGNVNMVARQQSEAETASPAAAASADAMAAYFARLTQERLGDDSSDEPTAASEPHDSNADDDSNVQSEPSEPESSDAESSKETNES